MRQSESNFKFLLFIVAVLKKDEVPNIKIHSLHEDDTK